MTWGGASIILLQNPATQDATLPTQAALPTQTPIDMVPAETDTAPDMAYTAHTLRLSLLLRQWGWGQFRLPTFGQIMQQAIQFAQALPETDTIIQVDEDRPVYVPDQYIIAFDPNTPQTERDAYLASIPGVEIEAIVPQLNRVVVRLPENTTLPDAPIIRETEPDVIVSASGITLPVNDPDYDENWAVPYLGIPAVWETYPDDAADVIVAVIDSGICAGHPDLAGRVLSGYDYVDNDLNPTTEDYRAHGCAAAGVIAANINNGVGIAGAAPNAQILPLRVLDDTGFGSFADVAVAIIDATDQGADVINLSLGSASTTTMVRDAVHYAASQGVILVAAAGNAGQERVDYPAAYPDVIAVGAIRRNGARAGFSNYGDGIDTVAPGDDIYTLDDNDGYQTIDGTSFSAPYVSAMVVLSKTINKGLIYDGGLIRFEDSAIVSSGDGLVCDTYRLTSSSLGQVSDNLLLNAVGNQAAFAATGNLTGENADKSHELFVWDQVTGIAQITNGTNTGEFYTLYDISDDGTVIVYSYMLKLYLWREGVGTTFIADEPLDFVAMNADASKMLVTLSDPDHFSVVRLWDETNGLQAIPGLQDLYQAQGMAMAADGSHIILSSAQDLTGENSDNSVELFLWSTVGGYVQITNDLPLMTNEFNAVQVSDDGQLAFYEFLPEESGNPAPTELWKWNATTATNEKIFTGEPGSYFQPSLNADGTKLAFSFSGDPLGTNSDGKAEVFAWDAALGLLQLTDSATDSQAAGEVNATGNRILYLSSKDSDSINLYLLLCDEPPLILQQPVDQHINYDESVTFTVEAAGPGILGYQWYEGVSGSTVRPVGDNSPTLTIDNVQAETGYWVRVVNNYGHTDSQTATVTINNLPQAGPAFVVNTTEDVNDGLCDQLHCSLREAILAANQNADDYFYTAYIDLPAGTYPISIDGRNEDDGETGDFDIKVSLEIKGISAETTIIDAQGKDRIFHYVNPGKSFLVEDVTLQNGLTELEDDATQKGRGAVLLADAIWKVELSHVAVRNNQAAVGSILWVMGGPSSILFMPEPAFSIESSRFENNMSVQGGIHINGFDNVGIYDSQFLNNTADAGSALYITSGDLVNLYDSVFQGNQGVGLPANQGGTIYSQANMYVYRTRFEDNHMSGQGGVFYNAADLFFFDSTFLNNTAAENGGTIYNDGRFFIFDTQFTGNAAGLDGGAIYSAFTGSYDATSLTNYTLFKNNAAGRDGGAIYSLVTYSDNTTFDGNKADRHGGAIYNDTYTSLHFVTLTDNVADADSDGSGRGGGINRLDATGDDGMEFSNTVLYGNRLGDGTSSDCSGEFMSSRLNFVGTTDTFCQTADDPATVIFGGDPLLGALQDNGGDTETRLPQPGSPLVGAADLDTCPVFDQRRITRDKKNGCDIGAAEVIQPEQIVADNLAAELDNFVDVSLSWVDNTDEETAYHVERSEDGENWAEIAVLPTDTTLYQDTGLACYTEYFYRLRTINAYGTFSAYSGTIGVTTNCPDPELPQDFIVTGKTRDSLSLSWVDVDTTDTTYAVDIWLPLYQSWQTVAQLDGTTEAYTHTGLTCAADYQFRLLILRASDSRQAVGGVLSDTTADCPPLPAPDNVTVQAMGRAEIQLQWAHSLPAETDFFQVERSPDGSSWSALAKLTPDRLSFSDDSVLCDQTYHYRVGTMRSEDGAVTYSASVSALTDACPVQEIHTVGLYKAGLWQFRDDNSGGAANLLVEFGPQQNGWLPITGNWDGMENDGLGVYQQGQWILRDVSDSGVMSAFNFNFGPEEAGWLPIVGDWDGDDIDTVGLYKDGTFMLRNSNSSGGADIVFRFGDDSPGYIPIAGDWNGSGQDTVGVYKDGLFYLTNRMTDQALTRGFRFGPQVPGWQPLTGDWDEDGVMTVGLYQMGVWRLRDTNSTGAPDVGFSFGSQTDDGWQPVARYRGGVSGLQVLRAALHTQPESTPTPPTAVMTATQVLATPTPQIIEPEITAEVTLEPEITAEPTLSPTSEPTAEATNIPATETPLPTAVPATSTPMPTATPGSPTAIDSAESTQPVD